RPALDISARSVRIWELSGAQRRLANALLNHAEILIKSGDYSTAAEYCQRALDIRKPLLGPSHPSVAETEVMYSAAEAQLGRRQDAYERALRGDEIGRAHAQLTLSSLSERQAMEYAAIRPKGFDLAVSLMSLPVEHAQVLDALILGRSLTLDEIGARQRLRSDQRSDSVAALWTQLSASKQRLANMVIRGPSDKAPEQYTGLVDEARREKERIERTLAEQSAAFGSQLARTAIGLDEVRAALPPDTALVSFVKFTRTVVNSPSKTPIATRGAPPTTIPSYVAFVLRPDHSEPAAVQLGRADTLESLILQWRQALMPSVAQPPSATADAAPTFGVLGANLRRRIWDPVAGHLAGVNRVFVVPDNAVNLVPLAALPVKGSRYLLEDGPTIHYLSAERDLVAASSSATAEGLLAIGGPAFADGSIFASLSKGRAPRTAAGTAANPADARADPVGTVASKSVRGTGSNCPGIQSMQFPRLPGSRREAEEVAGIWVGSQTADARATNRNRLLTGREASEAAVKQLAPGMRILHFATHGFFLNDDCMPMSADTRAVGGLTTSPQRSQPRRRGLPENPLLLSGLAFAGANRRVAAGLHEDDGILTAEEAASLNLQGTEWAVLSACQTGLGEIKAGEGVLGLRRAFQIAGARTVIMSLWSVDDQATRAWMRALYEGRLNKHLNTADAVRNASLEVLQSRRARGQSTHPFYWAAFVAAGDWH
ncbi:MAG TPA: CHAT domain-containing tetratricopeptide repeat protein, partial [Vicinamibacterales bacterium]|nr:CHAT domain-containing tetratricopeptide repeat protein [Vicinamibacterales bacterium]